jgi:PEP-CTERM motif
MKKFLLTLGFASLMATVASAGTVTYSTEGAWNGGASGANSAITVGGLTLTFNAGSGALVNSTPGSFISLGNIVLTGTSTGTSLNGTTLTLKILETAPGSVNGTIVAGLITGTISTNQSSASIVWSPNNTTTAFAGNLPGVILTVGNVVDTYQVTQTTLGLQAPGVGTGTTSIQGAVSDTSAPEPATLVMMGAGLGAFGLLRRRRAARA